MSFKVVAFADQDPNSLGKNEEVKFNKLLRKIMGFHILIKALSDRPISDTLQMWPTDLNLKWRIMK